MVFAMHEAFSACVLLLLGLGLACGGGTKGPQNQPDGSGDLRESPFWDALEGYKGGAPATYPVWRMPSFDEMYDEAALVVVGRPVAIVGRENQEPPDLRREDVVGPSEAEEEEFWQRFQQFQGAVSQAPDSTGFRVDVQRWLKGSSPPTITVKQGGGWLADGTPYVVDGDFLLEIGRTYLMVLRPLSDPAVYARVWDSRGGFDVTRGTIRVYKSVLTQDLKYLEGLTVDEFLVVVSAGSAQQSGP